MDSEMNSLTQNNTWVLVNKSEDKNVIDVKTVYRNK